MIFSLYPFRVFRDQGSRSVSFCGGNTRTPKIGLVELQSAAKHFPPLLLTSVILSIYDRTHSTVLTLSLFSQLLIIY